MLLILSDIVSYDSYPVFGPSKIFALLLILWARKKQWFQFCQFGNWGTQSPEISTLVQFDLVD